MEGKGWKKMAVALQEVGGSLEIGGKACHNRGRLGFGLMEEPSGGSIVGTIFHTARISIAR